MSQKFIKNKEDFVCLNCRQEVSGDGYTNHCPACLWSRHVDVFPGDRKENCWGLMEPIQLERKGNGFIIVHRCLNCGLERGNKTGADDDIGEYLTGML